MDKTAFYFAQMCGECHPGAGSLEYDREGHKYYDDKKKKFGYELSGKKPEFDGDYSAFSGGNAQFGAPWDKSGVVEADCLICHLPGYNWKGRSAALNGRKFRWAATIGAGWAEADQFAVPRGKSGLFSTKEMEKSHTGDSSAKSVTVDYAKNTIVDFKKLGEKITRKVPSENCWNCHNASDTKKRGRTIDPRKDIHILKMGTCLTCHPGDEQHNFAKGDEALSTVRDDLDMTMKTCEDCHLKRAYEKAPFPKKHTFPPLHYEKIGCQACHIPYKDAPGELVFDNATSGQTIILPTGRFLQFDTQFPERWLPALKVHRNKIRPFKELVSNSWRDLDEKTGMAAPIPLWKIRDLKKPVLKDDDGDGVPELNSLDEIKAFLLAIRDATDRYGNPISRNPALAKGGKIYKLVGDELTSYKDEQGDSHGFNLDHNVLPAKQALGAKGCQECHSDNSSFFHRKVLVDAYDEGGKVLFKPAWELMGYTAEEVKGLTNLESILEMKKLLYQ
ncbi:MAG: hypothetical protein ACOYXY_01615 [Thermodesulfobacteriota bacterium]